MKTFVASMQCVAEEGHVAILCGVKTVEIFSVWGKRMSRTWEMLCAVNAEVCDVCSRNQSICEADRHGGSRMACSDQLFVSYLQRFGTWHNIPWRSHDGYR